MAAWGPLQLHYLSSASLGARRALLICWTRASYVSGMVSMILPLFLNNSCLASSMSTKSLFRSYKRMAKRSRTATFSDLLVVLVQKLSRYPMLSSCPWWRRLTPCHNQCRYEIIWAPLGLAHGPFPNASHIFWMLSLAAPATARTTTSVSTVRERALL